MSQSQAPSLDMERLELFRKMPGPSPEFPTLLDHLMQLYLSETGPVLTHLQELCAQKDMPKLAAGAHRLAGSSAAMGALRMQCLAEEVYRAAQQGELKPLTGLLDRLKAEWEAVRLSMDRLGKCSGRPDSRSR